MTQSAERVADCRRRQEASRLYDEDFVVAMRKGHVLARAPTGAAFCRSQHLLVSLSGDPRGFGGPVRSSDEQPPPRDRRQPWLESLRQLEKREIDCDAAAPRGAASLLGPVVTGFRSTGV